MTETESGAAGSSTTGRRSGILLVDKPQGITSHDVVARTRRLAGTRKVGHAGTLDPMATGLLVLGVNSATRVLTYLVGLDKEYFATIRLGIATNTDDAEGTELSRASAASVAAITEQQLAAGIAVLSGEISQVPSSVSAIKVDGKRAYTLARAGETVDLASRAVTVSAFELLATRRQDDLLDLDVRVECSSGTYIRALARDLGATLDVGGHLTALRRSRIGPFGLADAAPLESMDVQAALLDPALVASRLFPSHHLDAQQSVDLGHGKRISIDDPLLREVRGPVAAIEPDGRLAGLVEIRDGVAKPLVNFPKDEGTA
ncbi:tRNA pseudouridine(55) synthase TruB [Parafrigoribacterium soli]|uniref:tRNA pseudouridine(55) synthase TruB n=1 Tax=Parafrigoribacterium soli TaxID=3144663 RepID=UPI0032EF9D6D